MGFLRLETHNHILKSKSNRPSSPPIQRAMMNRKIDSAASPSLAPGNMSSLLPKLAVAVLVAELALPVLLLVIVAEAAELG